MAESEDDIANQRWGEGEWERHECPYFEDRRMSTHSIHFHHDRYKCYVGEEGWVCNE